MQATSIEACVFILTNIIHDMTVCMVPENALDQIFFLFLVGFYLHQHCKVYMATFPALLVEEDLGYPSVHYITIRHKCYQFCMFMYNHYSVHLRGLYLFVVFFYHRYYTSYITLIILHQVNQIGFKSKMPLIIQTSLSIPLYDFFYIKQK